MGGRSTGGLGVDASVGGARGVNSNTTVGGGSGLGVGTRARVGGASGVNANVGARVGGSNLATANANATGGGVEGGGTDVDAKVGGSRLGTARASIGAGGTTLADILLGRASDVDADDAGPVGQAPNGVGRSISSANSSAARAINDMSPAERAKAKLRCKDVLHSGGYDASLTKLCKMVVSM